MPLPPLFGDPTRIRGYRWILLLSVMVTSWAVTWYTYSLGVLLPYLREDLELSPSREGWLGASFFLASFLLTIPLTNLFSRFPPIKLNAALLVATTGLFFLAASIPSYWPQFIIRFVVAALFVANNPVRTTVTHVWFKPSEYPAANGVANSMFGIVEPLAFWFSAPLAALLGGWQGTYFFIAGLSTVFTVVWLVLARERGTVEREMAQVAKPARSPLRVLRRREAWLAGLVAIGGGATWSAFVTFWPTVAQEDFGMSESLAGFVWGWSALGILPASLLAPYLLSRLGRRMPLIVGGTIYQLIIFPLMLVTPNVPFQTAMSLRQGLSWLFFPLLLTVPFQMRGVSAREIAVATAFIIVINRAGMAIGPAVAGGLAETIPLRSSLAILSAAPLLSVVAAVLLGEAEGRLVTPAEARLAEEAAG